ncbi:hypothetical protein CPB84DRAFT_1863065 [Gymnopilus junonius]|uniref:Peptidase S1 domain-containing protein n=1 Tax=Gymnopilus junonius TaxID=109634 RepID=A0A9P5P275_GYMJU|nr:hypothetical protein CPB84DRAFT_1863065 [Gymnopilus junonius]
MAEVANHRTEASTCAEEIAARKAKKVSGDDENGAKNLEDNTKNLKGFLEVLHKHKAAIVKLEKLYKEINTNWSGIARRNIGVLEYCPQSTLTTKDTPGIGQPSDSTRTSLSLTSRVTSTTLLGKLSATEFRRLMHPRIDIKPVVGFYSDGLLRIKGIVAKEQLANPESLDINGDPCFVVLKDGCVSDLTFGRYAGLESYLCDDKGVRCVELAIYNYDKQSRPFSSKGDSGSLLFNGKGEMIGLLHSGKSRTLTGLTTTYVTYATPAWRLRKWIMKIYPNADFAARPGKGEVNINCAYDMGLWMVP